MLEVRESQLDAVSTVGGGEGLEMRRPGGPSIEKSTNLRSSEKLTQRLRRKHGRMARGGHGLAKVSPRLSMPDPSMPCGLATIETALRLFQG
jgi:hypothetical protein